MHVFQGVDISEQANAKALAENRGVQPVAG
jgi:hypothetical protein